MKRNYIKASVNILAVLALVLGHIILFRTAVKIVDTSINLVALRLNAQYYNELPVKSDDSTAEYLKNHAKRQEYYNSDDRVVRIFSNLPGILKVIVLLIAISIILGELVELWVYVESLIRETKRKARRRKQKLY